MKLSEIRAILAEVDAAEAQLATDSEARNIRPETLRRRIRAYIAADRLDLKALVRQWLPIVEASDNLDFYTDDEWGVYPSPSSLKRLLKALEAYNE